MKRRSFFGGLAAALLPPAAAPAHITIYANGFDLRARGEAIVPTGEEQIRLIVRKAATQARREVTDAMAYGPSAVARALRRTE